MAESKDSKELPIKLTGPIPHLLGLRYLPPTMTGINPLLFSTIGLFRYPYTFPCNIPIKKQEKERWLGDEEWDIIDPSESRLKELHNSDKCQ